MKRIIVIWLSFLLAFGMAGCASSTPAEAGLPSSETAQSTETPDVQNEGNNLDAQSEGKVLVAYFSQTGNTKALADMIADIIKCDVFVIEPLEPYPDTYEETLKVAGSERAKNARPEYAGQVESMDDYDRIILGYPIWGGTLPMIVHSFLEDYDFSGKTVYPFCTSNYGGFFNSLDTLETALPDSVIGDGFAIRGSETADVLDGIASWMSSIGLKTEEVLPSESLSGDIPIVYMTADISSEGLISVYEALGWTPTGNVAVKITTGEPPASNYLKPEFMKDLVQSVNGTLVECNTAYGGSRASTAMHRQVAEDHGYTAIADVDIQDANGTFSLPVSGGTHLNEHIVGASFPDYESYIVLSHFKGHQMAGFGGAIKNISIGLGSSEGKSWIHSGGTSRTSAWGGEQDDFLRSMGDAGKAVSDYLGDRIIYINVMNRLSVDCDCNGRPAEPDMHDIGILASTDPVALDQACIDLVYAAEDGQSLINRIEGRNGLLTLEHAEQIGLGSRTYELRPIDN